MRILTSTLIFDKSTFVYFFNIIYLFIYLFLAAPGLSFGSWDLFSVAACGLLSCDMRTS